MNHVALTGNVGLIEDGRMTDNGALVVTLNVAENVKRKNCDEYDTCWWQVVTFQNLAERVLAGQFKIGDLITVYGKLRQDKFIDKNGHNRVITKIIAGSIINHKKMKKNNIDELISSIETQSKENADARLDVIKEKLNEWYEERRIIKKALEHLKNRLSSVDGIIDEYEFDRDKWNSYIHLHSHKTVLDSIHKISSKKKVDSNELKTLDEGDFEDNFSSTSFLRTLKNKQSRNGFEV